MKKLTLLLLCFLAGPTFAQDYTKELDSIVSLQEVQNDDPALFVGVVKQGQVIYQKVQGLSSLQHQVPATADSRCNIASTAKQFTALMILDLAQKGTLDLEDDIRKYFPNLYPGITDSIRIRHLLNHTSGIRDYCDLMGLQGNPWWRREGLDNEDVLDFISQQNTLAFSPGSRYKYSNTGYNILAEIIALLSEQKFSDYATTFFQELGMAQTSFPKSYMQVIPNLTLPYSDWGDGVFQEYPRLTSTAGEGFLYTSLKDQLHYEIALQQAEAQGNELLMASQKAIPNAEKESYGYGLRLTDRGNYPAVHHDGATGSYSSQALRFPEEQLSIFIMSSNSRVSTDALLQGLVDLLLEKRNLPVKYDEGLAMVPKEPLKNRLLAQYRSPSGALIRIDEVEGEVYWNSGTGSGIALKAEGENLYHPYYDESLKIGFYEDKLLLFESNGELTEYQKLDIPQASQADYKSFVGHYYNEEVEVEFELSIENDKLMLKRGDWENKKELMVFNRNEFRYRNYIFQVDRDAFDRVVGLYLNFGRALNNRFRKTDQLQFQPTIATAQGSVSVTTIPAADGSASDIGLTENYPNGNEIWYRQFGGSSYDKASSIIATEDGYLIIGSTSSYGEGNYDILLIKTNKKGKKQWQKTYGKFMNDYGYTAEIIEEGFLIKGSTQDCVDNDVFDCRTNLWTLVIDHQGKLIREEIGEELP